MSNRPLAVERALAALAVLLLPLTASADRYLVTFRDASRGKAAVRSAGGAVLLELGPQSAAAVELPPQAAAALAAHSDIAQVEVDPIRKPLSQVTPYGVSMVQAKDAQAVFGVTGANRKVCVIDSGLYTGHEDIPPSGVTGYPAGWYVDNCGHGTHVTGTIAALNNSTGVEGVLPNGVSLHMVKVFGDDCAWAYASTLINAANQCVTAGANIISMSLGGGSRSTTEENAFNDFFGKGILSIAAAGNDGSSSFSYPAAYSSVVSVAALNANKVVANFSQHNSQVDLAAPGVGVLSTVPFLDLDTLSVGSSLFRGSYLQSAARGTATGTLVDGGLCDSVGPWSGRVVLCQRGTIAFTTKVSNVQAGGGVAAVIYNNVSGPFAGTLSSPSPILGITISDTDGQAALAQVGQAATVSSTLTQPGSGYEAWDGTSMATPHVTGVAALVWSYNTAWTNQQIRDALFATAEDLGTPGRDDYYGYGLVRARAALDYLTASPTLTLNAVGRTLRRGKYVDLSWSGARSSQVDVYRNGVRIVTTANDGAYTDALGKSVTGSMSYKICEQGSSVCSNPATVGF